MVLEFYFKDCAYIFRLKEKRLSI